MTEITTVLLIKEDALDKVSINEHYLNLLEQEGIPKTSVMVRPLLYNTASKVLAKTGKAYLDKLISTVPPSVTKLIIADSSYYKFITKIQKVSSKYGATVKGAYKHYEKFDCVYVPNYRSLFKQPENVNLIEIGIKTIAGTGSSVLIHSAEYGFKFGSDREILDALHKHPVLTADIETTGLELECDVVSIAFAWTKHDGVAIDISITGSHYTKKFIEQYTGTLIFHGGLFDAKLLIRNWWMDHPTDYEGMLRGIHHFRDIDDTMLMAYLAKNATTQVALGLKELALEYVGNYAIEIEDVSRYTKSEILEYNLIDALGTFYVYEKYEAEKASRPYVEIFQPSIYPLLKMMLVGLPLSSSRVQEVHNILAAQEKVLREQIQQNTCVIEFTDQLREETCALANTKLKKLVKTVDDFTDVEFNPASHPQLAKLLFEVHKLPILDTTKTGQPATGGDTLEDLRNHTQDEDILDLLGFVQRLADVGKINGTFIKAFMREKDWVHGNLKLGGTQSGRLSSNDPNLTNLPAHGPMGKLVKSCIVAPKGWLFCGADFSALEERIGAILSQDPNRIKVYTDGFDGHSMRAHKYFATQMPDIVEALAKAETATKFWIDDEGEYCCA
jgi:DNA polymerase I